MRYILSYSCIIISVVFNSFHYKSALGQSQEYPPSFINDGFLYQNWTTQDGLPVNSVSSIVQSKKGYLWFGTEDGLVRFDGIRFTIINNTTHPELRYNRIKDITTFGNGLLILNSRGDVLTYENGAFTNIELTGLVKEITFSRVQELETRSVLFRSSVGNFIYNEGVFEEYLINQDDSQASNNQENYTWNAPSGEIFYEGEKIVEIGNRISDLILDHEGNAWVASFSKGLYRIKKSLFKVLSIDQGLPDRNIYPITETSGGTIWAGTFGKGIVSIKGEEVTSGYSFEGLTGNIFVQTILERSNGDILVGSISGLIFKYAGNKTFSRMEAPDFATINCFFEDSKNRLWVCTNSGLFYLEDGSWKNVTERTLTKAVIKDVIEAPDGSIWVGTGSQGLFHITESSISIFDKGYGISSDNIRSLWIPPGNSTTNYQLWVGTEDQGLNRITIERGVPSPQKVVTYNTDEGLFDQVIHRIIPDDRGLIWMSSNRGLFWVYYYELEEFAKGNLEKITSRSYTELDGLRTREFNGGIQPAGVRASDGMLWFPSQDGVVRVNPQTVTLNSEIPFVHIEEVESRMSCYDSVPSRVMLEKGDRDITLRFTALSYTAPQKNMFRYRLFGFEEEWTTSNESRTARYTNLDPGTYTFKVIGSNSEGLWNLQGALVTIVVPPYFYEAVWFYALIIVSIIISIILLLVWCKNKAMKIVSEKDQELSEVKLKLEETERKLDDRHKLKKLLLHKVEDDLKAPLLQLRENLKASNLKEIVESETSEMLDRIDQLFLLTRIEVAGLTLKPERIDLVRVVKHSLDEVQKINDESKTTLVFTSNTESVNILMDEHFIKIILKNLIRWILNNVEATKIRIQVIEESSMCTVKISDNGVSLENGELKKIFNLFKAMEYSEESGDVLGIHLPLAAKLVELHKATVVVHSIPDKGNIFAVVFKKGGKHLQKKK